MKQNSKGFTIVELLIVIIVIGILAAIVVNTYSGIQSKARNAKRQTDIQTLQTQLEAFFASAGYYPSNADMNVSAWRSTNMKSLGSGTLTDPLSGTSTLAISTVASGTYQYWYTPQTTDNASCETVDTSCAQYIVGANLEGSTTAYTKSNLD